MKEVLILPPKPSPPLCSQVVISAVLIAMYIYNPFCNVFERVVLFYYNTAIIDCI